MSKKMKKLVDAVSAEAVTTALRDALHQLPFCPMPPRAARLRLVDQAFVVLGIASALGVREVEAEALELLELCDQEK